MWHGNMGYHKIRLMWKAICTSKQYWDNITDDHAQYQGKANPNLSMNCEPHTTIILT